ncbi:MAG: hypothetical protein JNK29_00400, partial [Anaerolineales bacterium]|nr:hypothetical protein [Anaerolineales bacterium]
MPELPNPASLEEWGRRLDAGETSDPALQVAARLRAARPAAPPLPASVEAGLRARLLTGAPAPRGAQTRPGPRLHLGWWAATACASLLLAVVSATFYALSQPLPPVPASEQAPAMTPALPSDHVLILDVAPAAGAVWPEEPAEFVVTLAYTLTSVPTATLQLAWAGPTGEGAWDAAVFETVVDAPAEPGSNHTATVTVRFTAAPSGQLRPLSTAGRLTLRARLRAAAGLVLARDAASTFTYTLPPADEVRILAASPGPGELPADRIQPITVTVAYTLTSAPAASLLVGFGDDQWPGAEVDPKAGPIFAVGAPPVMVSAAAHEATAVLYADPETLLLLMNGPSLYLFANLSAQDAAGRWQGLAHTLAYEFVYRPRLLVYDPDVCPVTRLPDTVFIPPAPYHRSAPSAGEFWYGADSLWTALPGNGQWPGLPHDPDGYTQKVFWWRAGYLPGDEGRFSV